jgi:hypothetical protein
VRRGRGTGAGLGLTYFWHPPHLALTLVAIKTFPTHHCIVRLRVELMKTQEMHDSSGGPRAFGLRLSGASQGLS